MPPVIVVGRTRENARKTHCLHGHPYDLLNTYIVSGRRHCRRCSVVQGREYRLRQGKLVHASFLKWCEARPNLPHDIEVYREEQKEKKRVQDRRNFQNHKAERRAYVLRLKYGLSTAEYSALVIAQDGRCAICGQLTQVLSVDHDHITGRVRGLLCSICNVCIGQMGESPERLRKAADYLEQA